MYESPFLNIEPLSKPGRLRKRSRENRSKVRPGFSSNPRSRSGIRHFEKILAGEPVPNPEVLEQLLVR
jgi:hypothetical protein